MVSIDLGHDRAAEGGVGAHELGETSNHAERHVSARVVGHS